MDQGNAVTHGLRWGLLAGIALNLALVVARTLLYPPLLTQPGGAIFVAEPILPLLAYAALGLWLTGGRGPGARAALRVGGGFGLVVGALWVANIAVESLIALDGGMSSLLTGVFLLGGFALWGGAGFLAARRASSPTEGVRAAVVAAMLTVLIAIAFGLLLTFAALPRLEHGLAGSAEYARSGWHDLRAFAIANSFDSAFSHLLIAPVIATIVGALGALIGARTIRSAK